MYEAIFRAICVQSLAGGLLIAIRLLLGKLFGKRAKAGVLYALWLAVAIRLLVPLEAPGLLNVPVEEPRGVTPRAAITRLTGAEPSPEANGGEETNVLAQTVPPVKTAEANIEIAESRTERAASKTIPAKAQIVWLWGLGVFATAGYMLAANLRFSKRLRTGAARISVPSEIPVYATDADSLCLAGFFRPRIYIGRRYEADKSLDGILKHETAHRKSGDNWWLLLRNVICALYWFHPLVWLGASVMTRDCESACDERVTRDMAREERFCYAETLIRLSGASRSPLAISSGMATEMKSVRSRVARILYGGAKKATSAMLAVSILLACAFSFATGEAVGTKVDVPESFTKTPSFTAASGALSLLANGKLYRDEGGEWTLLGEYPKAKAIATNGREIYLCETGEEADQIARLRDGEEETRWALPEGTRVRRMVCAGEAVAFTAETASEDYTSPRTGKPYILNTASGSLSPIALDEAIDLCANENGELFALYETMESHEWFVSRLTQSGEVTDLVFTVDPWDATELSASAKGLYFLTSTGFVDYWDFASEQRRTVLDPDALGIHAPQTIACSGDVLFVCDYDPETKTSALLRFDVALYEERKERVLTIANYSSDGLRREYMTRWFADTYPEVRINYKTVSETKLATSLMAGDSGVDLLYESATTAGAYALSGAYLPLDGFGELSKAMEESGFLDYRPAMTYDGKLYGVPDYVCFFGLKLNEPLLESLGLSWPQAPYSWSELADWAIDALAGTEYKLFSSLYTLPHEQYSDTRLQRQGEILLDTPTFRASVDAYRRLYKAGLIETDWRNEDPGKALAAENSLYSGAYAPMPTLEGEVASMAEVWGFYVVAATENIDLVRAYLEEYVSKDCQYNAYYACPYYMLLSDPQRYNRSFYDREGEVYRETTEALRVVSYDTIVLNQRNTQIWKAFGYKTDWAEYLEGNIDIDEYINRAQTNLDMIQYE